MARFAGLFGYRTLYKSFAIECIRRCIRLAGWLSRDSVGFNYLLHEPLRLGMRSYLRMYEFTSAEVENTYIVRNQFRSTTHPMLLNDLNPVPKRYAPSNFLSRICGIRVVPSCVRVFGSSYT